MKKLFLLGMATVSAFLLVACGGSDDTPLIIYQNKVEIDDVLQAYATAWGQANGVEVEVRTCGGDACGYADQIIAEFNSANQPDIFVIEGLGQFNQFRNRIMPLDGEAWIAETDVALTVDGVVYGFPINLEGWGLAYNAEILAAAGVDPSTLTSIEGYRAAFELIDSQLDELNLSGVVAMAAGPGLTWVTGLHNFNGYLSSGLEYDDNSVITDLLNGVPNMDRLEALSLWVELLFDFADPNILLSGTYDQMINAFRNENVAFLHQGNWVDPNLLAAPAIDFEVGYAPHASGLGQVNSIFVGPPSYFVVNNQGNNPELAKQFLNDLVFTEAGHRFIVEEALYVPAFTNIELIPSAPLSAVVFEYAQAGNIYAWWQNDMPPGFGMDDLGPIYFLFANGDITREQFIERIANEIRTLAP